MDAEVLEEVVAVERASRLLREQGLPAVPGLADPRRAMHVETEIALRPKRRLPRVHAHPYFELHVTRP